MSFRDIYTGEKYEKIYGKKEASGIPNIHFG